MSIRYIDGKEWVRAWKAAGQAMEEMRREDLQIVDVAFVIEFLDDAYEAARRSCPPLTTSGLVEQQKWFAKGRT